MARVLIACEFSGVVRDAFARLGHDAFSCDLLPTESSYYILGGHFQDDAIKISRSYPFDLMIAFPPCTHLSASGARWFKSKAKQQQEALEFIQRLADAPVSRIAIENPIGILSTRWRKPDQIIQPWQFGHPESKATCLWLKNLPTLTPTSVIEATTYGCSCGTRFPLGLGKYGCPNCLGNGKSRLIYDNQTPTGQNKLTPNKNRAQNRSRTYQGIANAMASQWGPLL